ncbi:hypothetical protein A3C09_00235 [Candidatus Uhrbacteria bacterium RIFCSPHIGHO2_02_FULL_47_44]|uniref:FHA domain-containing protein n=1 Tax=Candidatus Uhrbacteria bacterium RIFCSPLOWO2_02_FULL_48_18 TaxID=1802408 RepID=A0A1F7VBZ0_9BACT|nr:MAG: hypothetical protein A2839_01065 [Candidatus Uhrbacteria bacterium RIFCSPHIGHO2_01_FULL_47_10]OGL70124.1 MAG: hypothetical protein A3C09_00235 [Candidatus Uhrbacteria bacterium RIFCSPHIGHO2_02_FULL_47_44]OGL76778.1 MAG: hypothetical protein A3E97_03780 [Candidatus Uhrbacteria bacterium RIFCSPHIGHO2_12_FULL_47_12]OGL82363.1 MAG: hypothetical protein A3B20_01255 [Candidatus Uhrbacteria bacterium RIFCSPLOWO2_01_FULL_47_17]OGL88009.1 MAG: hypothetical protein A3I41_02785 [Candidatus Uhrbact
MNELALFEREELIKFNSGLKILYLGNERIRVSETYAQGFMIGWKRLESGPPIRVGREDAPPDEMHIHPEIDLSPVMPVAQQGCVSRLHAVIEWQDGKPMLRTYSRKSGTWVRRSGETRKRLLQLHEYHELKHGDMIQLGHPRSIYVRLRIQFLGAPTDNT